MARERCVEARKAIAKGRSPSQRSSARAQGGRGQDLRRVHEALAGRSQDGRARSRCARHHRPEHPAGVPQSADGRDRAGRPAQPVRQGQGARRAKPPPCTSATSSSRSSASQPARREGAEPGGRSRPLVDRHLRGQGPCAVAVEIRVMHRVLDATATLPTIRLALPDPADAPCARAS